MLFRHVLRVCARGTTTHPASPLDHTSRDTSLTQQQPAQSAGEEEHHTVRGLGRFKAEQAKKLQLKPDQPADARILRLAIIGLPNCGKSTLTNTLMGWRVCSVSKKVHTTRKNTTGIFTQDNVQIVFLDTPGILDPSRRRRHNLEKSLVIDPERSLQAADYVAVVVDVSDKWTRNDLDPLILQVLHVHQDKTAILILNKVDLLQSKEMLLQIVRSLTQGLVDGQPVGVVTKKSRRERARPDLEQMFDAMQPSAKDDSGSSETQILPGDLEDPQNSTVTSQRDALSHAADKPGSEVMNTSLAPEQRDSEQRSWLQYVEKMKQARRAVLGMKGWPHFKRVFMVSALSGDGISDLRDFLILSAQTGDWDYHSSLVTSQDPREVVTMCVKEKLLEHLQQEIPYLLDTDIDLLEVDEDGIFNVIVNVIAQNRRQVSFLMGRRGETIQKIASEAKQEIMNTFRCEMRLKLVAKLKRAKH